MGSTVRAAFLITYFTLPTVTSTSARIFSCVDFDDGSWLTADYSISCDDSPKRSRMEQLAGAFLVYSLMVVPYMMHDALVRFRDRINPPGMNEEAQLAARANDVEADEVRLAFQDWRPHLWYYLYRARS